MNREIKFRAWHKEKKFMMDVAVIDIKSKTVTSYTDYHCHASDSFIPFDDIVLMECIGLKDKNGKEIYEGDVIIAGWHWDTPHIVEFPLDNSDFIEYGLNGKDVEILGNVWENPELIVEDK